MTDRTTDLPLPDRLAARVRGLSSSAVAVDLPIAVNREWWMTALDGTTPSGPGSSIRAL